jgi:MFS family permease
VTAETSAGSRSRFQEEQPEEPSRETIGTVLRRPKFSCLVFGQAISQLGDKLHHMALIALVGSEAEVGTSGIALAQLAIVFTLPMIAFGPIAGALVDRWSKLRTLLVTDLLRAIIVAAIPLLYAWAGRLWPVYIMAFFVFGLGLFFNMAKMAIIPELVAHRQLLPANAALSFIGRGATIIGIVGGGVIVGWKVWERFGWTGFEAGFYLDAASYVVSLLTLLLMLGLSVSGRQNVPEGAAEPHPVAEPSSRLVKRSFAELVVDMRKTLSLIRHDRKLRFAFGTLLLLGVLAASIYVVMTVSVQTILGQGTRGVGYLGGLMAAGMLVGSLAVGTVGSRWDKRQTILVGCALIGSLMVVASLAFRYDVFTPVAFVGGMLLAPIMVSQDTLLHEAAPADGRALIFSARELILGAAFMISALAVGGGVALLGAAGVREAYRLALGVLGLLISATGILGEIVVLKNRREAPR